MQHVVDGARGRPAGGGGGDVPRDDLALLLRVRERLGEGRVARVAAREHPPQRAAAAVEDAVMAIDSDGAGGVEAARQRVAEEAGPRGARVALEVDVGGQHAAVGEADAAAVKPFGDACAKDKSRAGGAEVICGDALREGRHGAVEEQRARVNDGYVEMRY